MPVPTSHPVVVANDLSKRYGATPALTGVDLVLHAGEVVALLGPNGAGKSTLAGILTGRTIADAGEATVFGLPPRALGARLRMGVMLQSAGLPETLTVAEVVALQAGLFPQAPPVPATLAEAGLTDIQGRRCDALSGGQRQRVMHALAICGGPEFLVLDEPSVGLDPEARRGLWETVRARAAAGAAVLLATHHMDEAEALADRIVVVAGGRIVADSTPAALRASVAGSAIICRPALGLRELTALPGVTGATKQGADIEIRTRAPRATLEALFAADPALETLTVGAASLDAAIADLTTIRSLKDAA